MYHWPFRISSHCHRLCTSNILLLSLILAVATALNNASPSSSRRGSFLHQKLNSKSTISNMRSNLESITKDPNGTSQTEDDSYFLFVKYTNELRDSFTEQFKCKKFRSVQNAKSEVQKTVKEFKSKMDSLVPRSHQSQWSYEGAVWELESDLNGFIEDISDGLSLLSQQTHGKWLKRCRWLLGQCVLLLVNFVQTEVQRRMAYRAANKRLADIPEFPIM